MVSSKSRKIGVKSETGREVRGKEKRGKGEKVKE